MRKLGLLYRQHRRQEAHTLFEFPIRHETVCRVTLKLFESWSILGYTKVRLWTSGGLLRSLYGPN